MSYLILNRISWIGQELFISIFAYITFELVFNIYLYYLLSNKKDNLKLINKFQKKWYNKHKHQFINRLTFFFPLTLLSPNSEVLRATRRSYVNLELCAIRYLGIIISNSVKIMLIERIS